MWRHYSFASFSLPKGSSLFLTTFVQLSNPTVFNSPSHLTLSPILSLLYFYRFALLFLQLSHPTCTPLFHTTFSLKSSLPIEVSHIIRQTLSTQFFLFFSLSFSHSYPPPSYFHCPLTRPLPVVLLGAKAKKVSN